MFLTFSYDTENNYIHTTAKVWADFSCHIPLIRSFSVGGNFDRFLHGKAPEHPLYSGETIKYHFLFFMFVGLLERLGLRIDWALNIPSIFGFFLLSSMVFIMPTRIFKSIWVGVLSLTFFLLNGSFAFIDFFFKNPISGNTLSTVIHNNNFWGLAPWGPGDISSVLWSLNIFTNQRHLAGALGLILLFIFSSFCLEKASWKKQRIYGVLWGLALGIFPFLHQPGFLMFGIVIVWYWLTIPSLRKSLTITGIVGGVIVLPQVLGINHGSTLINWHPGYIIRPPLTFQNIVFFWWQNLGLHSALIPFGFLIVPARIKKYFFPLFIVFVTASLVTFSPDPATNHKFFNFSLILGNMLSAYVLALFIRAVFQSNKVFIRIFGVLFFGATMFLLTFSGVIDLFAVLNDDISYFPDIKAHPVTSWVVKNTKTNDYILNSSYFTPVTYAGRSIFIGYLYATWSAGYDNATRERDQKIMLESVSVNEQCELLNKYNLDYVILEYPPQERSEFIPNYAYFASHDNAVFTSSFNRIDYTVYSVKSYCNGV